MKKVLKLSVITLFVAFMLVLASCMPKSLKQAIEVLEKKDYEVTTIPAEEMDSTVEGLEGGITAFKEVNGKNLGLFVFKFDTKDHAEKYYVEAKKGETIFEDIRVKDKWLYAGDVTACDDFEKATSFFDRIAFWK